LHIASEIWKLYSNYSHYNKKVNTINEIFVIVNSIIQDFVTFIELILDYFVFSIFSVRKTRRISERTDSGKPMTGIITLTLTMTQSGILAALFITAY